MFGTFAARVCLPAFLLIGATSSSAMADNELFKQLNGSWRGSGTLNLTDGGQERITCRGYYNTKSGGLTIAILCNSPNYKVELRSNLSEGGQGVSGSWEERTFHASGNVSGRVNGNRMNLSINGAVTGSLSVSLSGGHSQNVTISTQGTGFRGVSISLVRG
jgi:hypothetical protein